jgi:hypothetical protein
MITFVHVVQMILPSSIPNKKLAVIDQVLKQCQLERNPMACEDIVDEFNDLRSDIVLLFDLKNALNSAEYEFQTSLHRLKHDTNSTATSLTTCVPLASASCSSLSDASRLVTNADRLCSR